MHLCLLLPQSMCRIFPPPQKSSLVPHPVHSTLIPHTPCFRQLWICFSHGRLDFFLEFHVIESHSAFFVPIFCDSTWFWDPSMLLYTWAVYSFLILCDIPLYDYPASFFIPSPVDQWFKSCFQLLLLCLEFAVNICVQVFAWTQVSFLLGKCREVELLSHMLNVY